jgi:polysaccharide biosynthesis transport protein
MNEHLPAERSGRSLASPTQNRADDDLDFAGPSAFGPDDLGRPEFDVRQLAATLRRNLWLVLAATAISTAIATYFVMSAVPQYGASASLRFQDERRMISGSVDAAAMDAALGRFTDPLLSQTEFLRSRSVIGEVVDREGLRLGVVSGPLNRGILSTIRIPADAVPDSMVVELRPDGYSARSVNGDVAPASGIYGQPVTVNGVTFAISTPPVQDGSAVLRVVDRDRAINNVTARVRIAPRERTNFIDVHYTSPDPAVAQRVVNSLANVFKDRSQSAAQEQSRRRREFVQARLVEIESVLGQAQTELSDFQRRELVFSSAGRFEAQQVTLHNLEVRREEYEADRRMFTTLRDVIGRSESASGESLRTVISSPGIVQNPVIGQLWQQLVRYEVARDSLRASGASSTNPDYERVVGLIASTETSLLGALQSHIQALEARIAAVDETRRRHAAELASMPVAQAEEARLVLEVQGIQRMAEQLRMEEQQARIAEAVEAGNVEVVDLAPLPAAPLSNRGGLKIAVGLLLGLMIGSGGAVLREQLNTALRTRDDIEGQLQLPSLAVVPKVVPPDAPRRLALPGRRANGKALATTNGRPYTGADLIAHRHTHSPASEAYRSLRTNLIFSQVNQSIRMLVVTSSVPSEGKSTTASNLAISYAQQGMSVLLVDADLRKPRVHKIFRAAREPGLSEFVLGRLTVAEIARETEVPNLFIVTSGVQPPNPAEMIGGSRMRAAADELIAAYDLVIFDTPPVLAATESAIMAARADAVVLVVRAGSTDRTTAKHALEQLRNVNANIVGVVLNDPDGNVPKYSSYDYYYQYYGADETEKV